MISYNKCSKETHNIIISITQQLAKDTVPDIT